MVLDVEDASTWVPFLASVQLAGESLDLPINGVGYYRLVGVLA